MNDAAARARLAAFYEAHWQRLWAFLVRVGAEPSAAQDLAQEAFARWALSPAVAWDDGRARAYLFTIGRRLLIDAHRRTRREAPLPDLMAAETVEPDFPLGGAWNRLEPRERLLLWLAYAEEFSHAEIAEIAGVRPASVRVLLSRARDKARVALTGEE